MNQAASPRRKGGEIKTIVGILLCTVLTLVLVVNITLIVRSYLHPAEVPSFMGYKPFIVLSGSMEPAIMPGDLIITKIVAPEKIAVGDIISFRADKSIVVSHRVKEIQTEGGLAFLTQGDANSGADTGTVGPDAVEGIYLLRIAGLGKLAMFLQTPLGLLTFVILPLCLFILYDIVSRRIRGKQEKSREAALEAELESLRAMVAANDTEDPEQRP